MPIHDSSAMATSSTPRSSRPNTSTPTSTTSEHHHGQTVPDWRGQRERDPNVNVALDVDSARFLDMYQRRLTEARP